MAGHSAWKNIKHKKAKMDAKRGKIWSKCSRAIIVAAKNGGGNPDMNLALRYAIDDARAANMPKDTIENAIKKGTGELAAESYESALYEGYGPAGVAILLEILTDNRNRTAGEVRKIFDVNGGKLGSSGCVAFLFDRKGLFVIPGDKVSEERLMEIGLEAGADDIKREGDKFEILCSPENYVAVSEALTAAGIEPEMAQVTRIPNTTVDLDLETARKVLKLMEQLDDHDDVQSVASNFKISDEAMEELAKG